MSELLQPLQKEVLKNLVETANMFNTPRVVVESAVLLALVVTKAENYSKMSEEMNKFLKEEYRRYEK